MVNNSTSRIYFTYIRRFFVFLKFIFALIILAKMKLAERGGFEPPIAFWAIHALQACALNRSAISPAVLPNQLTVIANWLSRIYFS